MMGRNIHGRWHDDKMSDDHEGYMTERELRAAKGLTWYGVAFLALCMIVVMVATWKELVSWWRCLRGGLCG